MWTDFVAIPAFKEELFVSPFPIICGCKRIYFDFDDIEQIIHKHQSENESTDYDQFAILDIDGSFTNDDLKFPPLENERKIVRYLTQFKNRRNLATYEFSYREIMQ